jgi:hypothetical protein
VGVLDKSTCDAAGAEADCVFAEGAAVGDCADAELCISNSAKTVVARNAAASFSARGIFSLLAELTVGIFMSPRSASWPAEFFDAYANEILIWTCETYAFGGKNAITNERGFSAKKNVVAKGTRDERQSAGVKTPASVTCYGTSKLVPCYEALQECGMWLWCDELRTPEWKSRQDALRSFGEAGATECVTLIKFLAGAGICLDRSRIPGTPFSNPLRRDGLE